MRILILGGGGREHAIAEKLKQESKISEVMVLPGNAGTQRIYSGQLPAFTNEDIVNFDKIRSVVLEYQIDLLFVGPELPLAMGIKDFFSRELPQLIVFGPDQSQARLEASKIFSFETMKELQIPQADGASFDQLQPALEYIFNLQESYVIKADGLAAGKGVSIHHDQKSGESILKAIFEEKIFAEAGQRVLIQKFLHGTEVSVFAICNGQTAVYLPPARDYKRALDNDQGDNTGGMGSYCPSELIGKEDLAAIHQKVTLPILKKMQYRGVLYIGLMLHSSTPGDFSVIEFNCRLGDPETQAVMAMLEGDFLSALLWSENQHDLRQHLPIFVKAETTGGDVLQLPYKPGICINVVLAAKGYPHAYSKNIQLKLPVKLPAGSSIIHAQTKNEGGHLLSNGGRILNILAYDKDKKAALTCVYRVVSEIFSQSDSEKLFYRKDIAQHVCNH